MLSVDATPYRGVVEVLPAEEARISVVNVVPLEEYLRGVVPNELAPEAFPQIEAQKAQAVAARSYALAHLGDYSSRGYDLCATAACQVYRGSSSEHPLTDRAVAETRGTVATWRGRPIHAFYTSTCGGHTEEGTAVFEDGAPYLRGVACPTEHALADEARPGAEWEVRLRPKDVARAITRYGDVGQVLDLVPTQVGVSGRVVELRVVGSKGDLDLRGQRVQLGLGLRESLFVLHRETGAAGRARALRDHGQGLGPRGGAVPGGRVGHGARGSLVRGDPEALLHRRRRLVARGGPDGCGDRRALRSAAPLAGDLVSAPSGVCREWHRRSAAPGRGELPRLSGEPAALAVRCPLPGFLTLARAPPRILGPLDCV